MSSDVAGLFAGVAVGLAASPYLARLTLSVPDRDEKRWWTGRPAGRTRLLLTGLTAAVLGGLAGVAAGWSALLPAFLALALAGAPLVVIDYEHHRLPNRLVVPMAVAAVVLLALAALVRDDWSHYLRGVEGGAAVYAVLFVLWFIAPKSFGLGDVKLGGVLGGYLGWFGWLDVYYGIFAGFLLGAVLSLVLLAARRVTMKTALAFGPMLIVGSLIVMAFDLTPSLVS